MIVDLAVKNDHYIAVFCRDGLIAAIQIQNFQPGGSQRDALGFKHSLLIRSTVQQRTHRISNPRSWWVKRLPRKPCNSTQIVTLVATAPPGRLSSLSRCPTPGTSSKQPTTLLAEPGITGNHSQPKREMSRHL